MNPNPNLLDNLVWAAFTGLCNLTWRVALVTAVTAVCTVWLPAQNRSLRYTVWLSCLAAMIWVTVGAGIGSLLTGWLYPPAVAEWLQVDWIPTTSTGYGDLQVGATNLAHIGYRIGVALNGAWWWVPWAVTVLWMAGAIAMAGRFAASRASLFWLRENAHAVHRTSVLDMFRDLSAQMGVRRETVVLSSTDVKSPVVVGMIHPAIILPESVAESYPTERLEPVLIHELAHIRRRDYIANTIQRILGIALFFHPLYWFMCRMLASERERSCDDYVIRVTRSPRRYALCLAELAEHVAGQPDSRVEHESRSRNRRSDTLYRVDSLVSRKSVPPRPSVLAVAALIIITTVLAVPISASRLVSEWRSAGSTISTVTHVGSTVRPQELAVETVSFKVGDVGRWNIQPGGTPTLDAANAVNSGEGYQSNRAE